MRTPDQHVRDRRREPRRREGREALRARASTGGSCCWAEGERPYKRPPLSKEYLRGREAGEIWVHDDGSYDDHDIELRLARPVTASTRAPAR